MSYSNLDEELLVSVYKNALIGRNSIDDIYGQTDEEVMRTELKREYDGYDGFLKKISAFMGERGVDEKSINPMQKAFMFASVKMNTFADGSTSHVAELMIKGTVAGITELTELLNGNREMSEEVRAYAEELLSLEEEYESRLKKML